MTVDIIIPIYNEEKVIENFLEELEKLTGEFTVTFVDGGGTDDTRRIIGEKYTVLSSPKGRANQMNLGAEKTENDILWFLHCDSLLDPNSIKGIIAAIQENPTNPLGCFSLYFDSNHPLMKICGLQSRNRVRFRKIAFGDQGIFMSRDFFEKIGGFPQIPIMEDYEFSIRCKEKGYSFIQLSEKIITDARRYENNGILKTMWEMQVFQYEYRKERKKNKGKKEAEEIVKKYKDER